MLPPEYTAPTPFPNESIDQWAWGANLRRAPRARRVRQRRKLPNQYIAASIKADGRAAVVWDTGAVSRGSGNAGDNKEKTVRQWFVDQAKLKALEIPLPPLPEQKKISHILSTVQRALEEQEQIIQTTTELKKALMHKLFTEGTRNEPQKQTDFGWIPKSWEVLPLSGCAVVQTGIAKGRKVDPKEAVEVPYLRVANVQDGYLDLSEMKTITIRRAEQQRFALETGDVVLTEGGDFDKLGRGFIWHGQVEDCVHQNHVFAVSPDAHRLSSEFFAYQAQSPYGKSYFLSVAHRTTNLACINTTKLKAFPVLLPPKDQQKEIVAACHGIDGRIQVAQLKKRQLEDLFRTFLHKLMKAEIRVMGFSPQHQNV